MEEEERREEVVRRVRSVLKLASTKAGGQHESPKERARKETEFFKRLFMQCDTNGTGTLSREDVIKMARKHLKIAERIVSDEQLMEFFSAIDTDGGGEIDFTEFLSFIRAKEDNSHMNDLVLKQVKRAVRLAIRRRRMTLQELEYRFYNSAAEGIIDTVNSDGSLGPEEMRRFFRKVLDVNVHATPDKNLVVAFKAMDEDGGGTLDAIEFMNFIRSAITEETTLCPSPKGHDPNRRNIPDVLAGMRGAVPERFPKARPGTTHVGGVSSVPFCLNGRDLEPRMRAAVSTPALLQEQRFRPLRSQAATTSNLLPTGLPKTPSSVPLSPSPSSKCFSRTGSATFLTTAMFDTTTPAQVHIALPTSPKDDIAVLQKYLASARTAATAAPRGNAAGAVGSTSPAVHTALPTSPKENSKSLPGEDVAVRGTYTGNKGSLDARDAKVLNRIEERLFTAGVDVRGWYHKRH